jgi:glyoxylase-like metal-dependent hydrolase (beta-lactamase superfamily II)
MRLDLGEISVHALTDCAPAAVAAGYAFPDADFAAHPQLAAQWMAGGLFRTRFGAFLIRTQEVDILVDCGLGPDPVGYFPGLRGGLLARIEHAGSSADRIGIVLFTHLHVDHVGWATKPDGMPLFPRARYLVGGAEWAHWSRLGDHAGLPHHVAAVRRSILPLAQAGLLHPMQAEAQIAPGIKLLPTPGHTPGHQSILVKGAHRTLLIAGDLWHNPAQVAVPCWGHRADMDRSAAMRIRTAVAERASREGWIIGAGHFVEAAAFGRIRQVPGSLSFEPLVA